MIDIVLPKNNEDKFISIAEKLGYKELLFLYSLEEYAEKQKNPIKNTKIKIIYGILANEKNIQKINSILEKQSFSGRRKSFAFSSEFKNIKVFVAVKSSIGNREIIERSQANLIFSLEESGKKDFMHQRGSGLDHILAKLAHDKNVAIGFSLTSAINSKNKGIILGRMMQNIMLCRKYKVKTIIASFAENPFGMRSPYDIMSLFATLGMQKEEAKESLKL